MIEAHGGALVDLMVADVEAKDVRSRLQDSASWDLTGKQLCDLELLLTGGFSPLRGFLGRTDYESVCDTMRLADGTLWPIPVVLDVTDEMVERMHPGQWLALRDPEGVALAALQVHERWRPDRKAEAERIFGTLDEGHPGVDQLLTRTHPWYVAGALSGLELPTHHDYHRLRLTPRQLRARFQALNWQRIVAFQTRNPLHRAHLELTVRAAHEADARLLIHPVVGMTKPGDVDHYTRVRCYQAIMPSYPPGTAMLSLLPLAMRMAGPREAVWHAIIRKNHGVTHFIVGRDHAGPGVDAAGRPYYDPYAAQALLREHQAELGVEMIPFRQMVYAVEPSTYLPEDEIPPGAQVLTISGTQLRRLLNEGQELPDWFTPAAVAAELRRSYPSRRRQGFAVFFTGLSGAGKSTLANALMVKLLEIGGRRVTLLDGDIVRKELSSELGFSREHRDLNIRRIGFVASEISKHGGVAICAPIAPYDATRKQVRRRVEEAGAFILVHVATPLAVCEARDRKGLYARARAGLVKEFTGISDPYEEPNDAEIVIDTSAVPPSDAVQRILGYLVGQGLVDVASTAESAAQP